MSTSVGPPVYRDHKYYLILVYLMVARDKWYRVVILSYNDHSGEVVVVEKTGSLYTDVFSYSGLPR
jgi:hypothetical protein